MAKQRDRTHSGKSEANASGWTIRSLDGQARSAFSKWLPLFQKRIGTDELTAAWNVLLKGCDPQDLEWAFYWAIDNLDTADYAPEKLRAFHDQSVNVLHEIESLRPAVNKLVESKMLGEPMWYQYFALLRLPLEDAYRFRRFPADLARFEARLRLFKGRKRSGVSAKTVNARVSAHWGAVLHFYIKECTGDLHHEETSVLLEAAAEAYNLETKTSFSQGAVEHRFTRFCRDHRKEVEEIERDIRLFRTKRLNSNDRLDLIPSLIAMAKAQAQVLIDEIKEHDPTLRRKS
jgi:hypothetical protein